MRHRKNKKEFSKSLLIQESVLIWITSLAYIVLAFYCISNGYTGSLPWITASASLPWAAYGVSQVFYYKKSMIENSKNGIKYETVLKEQNGFALIQLPGSDGAIRIRSTKLYDTEEEASAKLPKKPKRELKWHYD